MKVLACGSRDWTDDSAIDMVLRGIRESYAYPELLHGAARGADTIAAGVALNLRYDPVIGFPADWRGHGKAAGPIRNRLMLDDKPDLVVAFKDGFDWTYERGGTENMVRIAKEAGVKTYVVSHG